MSVNVIPFYRYSIQSGHESEGALGEYVFANFQMANFADHEAKKGCSFCVWYKFTNFVCATMAVLAPTTPLEDGLLRLVYWKEFCQNYPELRMKLSEVVMQL